MREYMYLFLTQMLLTEDLIFFIPSIPSNHWFDGMDGMKRGK